jgi:hypothetical protein
MQARCSANMCLNHEEVRIKRSCRAIYLSGASASYFENERRQMYLLDTNIFLDILMEREKSKAAKHILTMVPLPGL